MEDIVADVTKSINILHTTTDDFQFDEVVNGLFDFRTHETAKPVTAAISALNYLMNTQLYDITIVSKVLKSSTEQVKIAKAWWFDKWVRSISAGESKLDMVFDDDHMCDIETGKGLEISATFIVTDEYNSNWVSHLYNLLDTFQKEFIQLTLKSTQPEPLNMHIIGFENWANTIKRLNEV